MTVLHVFARIGYLLLVSAFWLAVVLGVAFTVAVVYGLVWDWRQRRATRRRRAVAAELYDQATDTRPPVRLPADHHNQLVADLAAHRMRRCGNDFAEWDRELTETHGSDA